MLKWGAVASPEARAATTIARRHFIALLALTQFVTQRWQDRRWLSL
jgi:hypothetical protein